MLVYANMVLIFFQANFIIEYNHKQIAALLEKLIIRIKFHQLKI